MRGHLVPMVDLRSYLGGGASLIGASRASWWRNSREVPAGLVVDEVHRFQALP